MRGIQEVNSGFMGEVAVIMGIFYTPEKIIISIF
jgi:hypothetical protein